MKLLVRNNHAVLVFGLGLVGSAIYTELSTRFRDVASLKLNWSSVDDCRDSINKALSKYLPPGIKRVDIIWSAGKTGFLATQDDVDADLAFFEAFNSALGKTLARRTNQTLKRYILISSAGGLFEGQTNVGKNSLPMTKRPYGDLKLRQETYIKNANWIDESVSLRLSSVYTVTNLKSRMGLIPTIVSRAIRQEFVKIFGTEMTLRDYVLDKDIGKFVSDHIDQPLPEEAFIIDGKPYSILEIKGMIERMMGKKVYLQYTLLKTNASNISFSPNIRAPGFTPSDLRTNLRVLYNNLSAGH